MDIIQAMQRRRSVRSFAGTPLTAEAKAILTEYASEVYNPFGGAFEIRLKEFALRDGYKPSTYGMITGAVDFFLMAIKDEPMSALAAGFCFEQIVLRAWQAGYGTCWIAATFRGTDFDRGQQWPLGELLRIICPVGTAAKKTLRESLMRTILASHRRKPYDRLFFDSGFHRPLSPQGRFGPALEMLRLAPSSANSQPWRAVVSGNTVHFYYVGLSHLSVLDTGIGLCHFWESERHGGNAGEFFMATDAPAPPAKCRYLISYKALQAG